MQSIPRKPAAEPLEIVKLAAYMVSEDWVYAAGKTFAPNEGLMDNIREGA